MSERSRGYLRFLLILYVVVSPFLAVYASVQMVERAQERSREANRITTCQWFGRMIDAYLEEPPTSTTGRNVVEAWLFLYRLAGCRPVR